MAHNQSDKGYPRDPDVTTLAHLAGRALARSGEAGGESKKKAKKKPAALLCPRVEWITLKQVLEIIPINRTTLTIWCAERRIDPKCGRKIGKKWFFKRRVIEEQGILLIDQP